MQKVIIADMDKRYAFRLHIVLAERCGEDVVIETITDRDFFLKYIEEPRNAEVLLISEDLYSPELRKHNFQKIFLLSIANAISSPQSEAAEILYKYSGINDIVDRVLYAGRGIDLLHESRKSESKIILVWSAHGGSGKTTVAAGLSECLEKRFGKTLYLNASAFSSCEWQMKKKAEFCENSVLAQLLSDTENAYRTVKKCLMQTESFTYLPAFRIPLASMGLTCAIYRHIAEQAKQKQDYSYIVIDSDEIPDEEGMALAAKADVVLMVLNPEERSFYMTGKLLSAIGNQENCLIISNENRNREKNCEPVAGYGIHLSESIPYMAVETPEERDNLFRKLAILVK